MECLGVTADRRSKADLGREEGGLVNKFIRMQERLFRSVSAKVGRVGTDAGACG